MVTCLIRESFGFIWFMLHYLLEFCCSQIWFLHLICEYLLILCRNHHNMFTVHIKVCAQLRFGMNQHLAHRFSTISQIHRNEEGDLNSDIVNRNQFSHVGKFIQHINIFGFSMKLSSHLHKLQNASNFIQLRVALPIRCLSMCISF